MGTVEPLFKGCRGDLDPTNASPGDGKQGFDQFAVLGTTVPNGIQLVFIDGGDDLPGTAGLLRASSIRSCRLLVGTSLTLAGLATPPAATA